MAFVPRVHNRQQPVANHQLHGRWEREKQARHLQKLQTIEARVDNKWGATHNGISETKRATYPHIQAKLKKVQMQDERYAEIELENYLLLTKLSKILERSHNPTKMTREWGGGVRLTPNQVPVIDHCVAEKTTSFGAAIPGTSLAEAPSKIEERERIARDNRALVRRLQMCRPSIETKKLEADFRVREHWLQEHANSRRPISANNTGGSRTPYEQAGAPSGVRRRPASAVVRRPAPPFHPWPRRSGGGKAPRCATTRAVGSSLLQPHRGLFTAVIRKKGNRH